jgi:pimeloyl-ACP methyl ester carboxylesterase
VLPHHENEAGTMKLLSRIALTALACALPLTAGAETAKVTKYPVVFAHGMAGWDSLGGFSYFGNDTGTFVGDSCQFLEINGCNDWLSSSQSPKTEAFQVSSMQSSEVRGNQLYDHVRSFMATTGAPMVNLIGHSQGGFDIRKVAHRLKAYYGAPRVAAMISIASPHRGTPYAKKIMDLYSRNQSNIFCGALPANPDGSDPCLAAIGSIGDVLFDVVNGANASGNDVIAGGLQLLYDDYDANDGKITGAKAFNANYNVTGVASYVASIITGQDDGNVMPLVAAIGAIAGINADGDGFCINDCDGDGAAGAGDGVIRDMDDDGLVPTNSQQMGVRLAYQENDFTCAWYGCWNPLDKFTEVTSTGSVTDINNPSSVQMTSHDGRVSQDHLDVVSLGPDQFDEDEFYAGLMNYIANRGF